MVALGLLFSGRVSGWAASSQDTYPGQLPEWKGLWRACLHACVTVHMWRSVDNFLELVLGMGLNLSCVTNAFTS